jgi:hypothetical protein
MVDGFQVVKPDDPRYEECYKRAVREHHEFGIPMPYYKESHDEPVFDPVLQVQEPVDQVGEIVRGAINLGRLEKVDVRDIWTNEATDFTPWLAKEDNLALLGQTIGLELELEAQEKFVGPFRADILCKDTLTNAWVLIENQLERTDHSHLGQLLTYAAGLDAVTIIWIAPRFTDEHRAALDWLNKSTAEGINFFGLEVELWRIGTSPAAPKFNIVSQPNDWTKTVTEGVRHIGPGGLTLTRQFQLEYWTAFSEYLRMYSTKLQPPKPRAETWATFAVGRTHFYLFATISLKDRWIRPSLEIYTTHAKAHFFRLRSQRESIEQALGYALDWDELPNKKSCRVSIIDRTVDPANRDQWPTQFAWLQKTLEAFHTVFAPLIKNLNADDYQALTMPTAEGDLLP